MKDETLDAISGNLVWLAIIVLTAAIIFVFVINPVKADEANFFSEIGEDYTYDDFYTEDYYRSHYQEVLFGAYIPMIVSWNADWNERVVYVEVDSSLLTGTDTACQLFGMMMKHITALDVVVHVDNDGYIPSTKNPIDHAWATQLAYPDGVPYIPAE